MNSKYTVSSFAGVGCIIPLIGALIVGFISMHAIEALLFWGWGADAANQWQQANVVLKFIAALLLSEISIPAWLLAFLATFAFSTPFF